MRVRDLHQAERQDGQILDEGMTGLSVIHIDVSWHGKEHDHVEQEEPHAQSHA